ncbi:MULTISPECIES: hypothetical protein [Micromonospora]|uniref:hypothetical protein n=1 Tax=Micromonospora TaxID=1873 RepID=UPI00137497F3|nr:MULTISPECIES: hypothetical protein [unclassified Micromonospora]MBM0224671.1 hypothetical protein [Micromonospora sp. ATA51]
MLSSLAVTAELTAATLVAVPFVGLPLRRDPRAVWAAGLQLTGPARDLFALAT